MSPASLASLSCKWFALFKVGTVRVKPCQGVAVLALTTPTRLDICCCHSLYFSSSCATISSVNASAGGCAAASCSEAMAALPKEACGVSMLPALEPVLAAAEGAAWHETSK